jgi:hypothetical protein
MAEYSFSSVRKNFKALVILPSTVFSLMANLSAISLFFNSSKRLMLKTVFNSVGSFSMASSIFSFNSSNSKMLSPIEFQESIE